MKHIFDGCGVDEISDDDIDEEEFLRQLPGVDDVNFEDVLLAGQILALYFDLIFKTP